MAQTATTLANVLKEVWTDDALQKQFFADDGPLKELETVKATAIGGVASVPIMGDINSAAYTSVAPAGGTLNPAVNQPSSKAQYTLVYHWFQIGLETAAIAQAADSASAESVVDAKMWEIETAIDALRLQITRQAVTNGDSIVFQCGTSGGSSTTLPLVASPSGSAYGVDAVQRNWVRPGGKFDIGTTADTDALATSATVTAVNISNPAAPTITLDTAVNATSGTHFGFIPNPNSATAANPEINGMRNIASTGALGGINPATAGSEYWQPATVDTTTSVLSLDLLFNMSRSVRQVTGAREVKTWTSLKQEANWNALLQNQVRFPSANGLDVAADGAKWNGVAFKAFNAILDSDLFMFDPKALVRIVAKGIQKPTWASELQGTNKGMVWTPNQTGFGDGVVWPLQLGARRRNGIAAAKALTA